MFYEKELRFLQDTFKRCRIHTHILLGEELRDPPTDGDLRWALQSVGNRLAPRTIYILVDGFGVGRILMLLPHCHPEQVLLIGPYLTKSHTKQDILEQAEQNGLSPQAARRWQQDYGGVTVLPEGSHVFAMLDAFGERIWGDDFQVIDINTNAADLPLSPHAEELSSPEDVLRDMEEVASRYAYENELIQAVEQGQSHKADQWLAHLSTMPFEKRSADPVRNLKNYSIIMNTLLRKAAERGGVHPFHLDAASSDFARRIEAAPSVNALQELMSHMFRSYCRLVKNHSMNPYSPPIQKVLTCVNADLTANLRLSALAKAQNISGAYLSALFRQEMGMTLTEYVNQKRMQLAMKLLTTTRLQIQTVAQHCGIMDVQYFSKVFKKFTGLTPKAYRENAHK